MPTHKSKAEERRAEWLTRQSAAERASAVRPLYVSADEIDGPGEAEERALAAARDAVFKAAMAWFATDHGKDKDVERELLMSCAALAKLEGDK